MCNTQNLESNMKVFKIMSIVDLVMGVALLIAGIVAVTYSLPEYCDRRRSDVSPLTSASPLAQGIHKALDKSHAYTKKTPFHKELDSSRRAVGSCGTQWSDSTSTFQLAYSGDRKCEDSDCGLTIADMDMCTAASNSGVSVLSIGALPGEENWNGPQGCHIQDNSNFQYNTEMGGSGAGGHTPVCLVSTSSKPRCENLGYWCGDSGCDTDNCCGTPRDPTSTKACCFDVYCTCDSSRENCDCANSGIMCDGSPSSSAKEYSSDTNSADWDNYVVSSTCESDRDDANSLMQAIALWGTLPGIVPIIFGAVGVFVSMKSSKCGVGVVLGFSILGFILCAIGFTVPMLGASIVTTICDAGDIKRTSEGVDWCDRYGGSLWAVVALNIILAIYQLAFSIVGCCFCCASAEVWEQANGGTPAMASAPMGAVPPAPAQAYPVQGEAVPMAQVADPPK